MMYFEPYEIDRILSDVIERFIIPRFNSLGMNATGEWRENLEVVVSENSGTIRGRHYSEQLAKGRRPGAKPPIAPLQKWAVAKFGLSQEQAKSMAFAVANKIAKEGTTWYEKGGSDLIEVLDSRDVVEFIQNEMNGILTVRLSQNLIRNAEILL